LADRRRTGRPRAELRLNRSAGVHRLNLVFDLGGVVVHYDRARLMAELYADPALHAAVDAVIERHFEWADLDKGTLSEAEAIARAAARCGIEEKELARFFARMAAAWTLVPGTVDLLYRLRARGYALYCLSNMHPESTAFLEQAFDFWEVFTGRVISCRVGACKPEPAIYAHLLERHGLAGSETIFVDDLDVNLAAARAFGIRTVRFEDAVQCARALRALGVTAD
jgi:putative hydrolase of the HAD superfamily